MTTPTAPAVADTERGLITGELDRSHGEMRDELGRANATALGIAGTVVTLAGVGLAVLLAGDWSPAALPVAGQVAWWAGSAATLIALAALAAAVTPRMPPAGPGQPPVHWAAISAYAGDIDALTSALQVLAVDPRPRTGHLIALATIAAHKWARVRVALLTLAAATVLLAVAALSGLTTP